MTPTVRGYQHADLPRLEDALARWIKETGACGYGHVGEVGHRIYEIMRGQDLTAQVQVWEDGAEIAGFALCGMFGSSFQVYAAPAWREGAAETAMLQAAAAQTAQGLAPDALLNTDVYRCDAVRRALLQPLGFSNARVWDLVTERELAEPLPVVPLPDGYALGVTSDAAALAALHNAAFDADWTAEQYRQARSHQRDVETRVVRSPDGALAAFTAVRRDPLNRSVQFEPVGTHPAFQRRGLARALLAAALTDLRAAGFQSALISHDAGNAPARALYAGLGFTPRYETLGYVREPRETR